MLIRLIDSVYSRFVASLACGQAVRALTLMTAQDRLPHRSDIRIR